MSLVYRLMADAVVVIHFGYVAFVVLGQLLILCGWLLRWKWIRNRWFRSLHLLAITVVVLEAWAGITCPLTTWEHQLRQLAGQSAYQGDFIANWVHEALFIDAPRWVFTVMYTAFGALVGISFFAAPPHFRNRAIAAAAPTQPPPAPPAPPADGR